MVTVAEIQQQLKDIQTAVTNVNGDVESLIALVDALSQEVAGGRIATQADLNDISTAAQGIKDSLSAVDDKTPSPS